MIWILSLFLPVLLSFVVLFGRIRPGWYAALLGGAAIPALAAGLTEPPGTVLSWFLLESAFGLDETRRVLLTFTAALWGIAGVYAGAYLGRDASRGGFGFFFLLAMAGNIGLIVARDVPLFYTCFVLMTFASYGLVIHTRKPDALRAGRIYIVMAILGEILLLAGIFLVVAEADSFLLEDMGPALGAMEQRNPALLLLLAGFGVKAGAVPLYFWLPLAHPVAPTPASAVLSGAMIKAGLIGWLHFSTGGGTDLPGWSGMIIGMGLLAALGAVALGLFQTDPKTNLAYSSISQMGLMTVLFGIGLASADAAATAVPALALYAWNHGLAKGALFLGTGVALAAGRVRPWILACLALPAAAIAGAPLTGGMFAKYGLKDAAAYGPEPWVAIIQWALPISALGTALLLGRFLWLYAGKSGSDGTGVPPRGMAIPWIILLGIVALGTPWALSHFDLETARPSFDPGSLLEATWPLVAAAAILLLAARVGFGRRTSPAVPPGDFIVVLESLLTRMRQSWKKPGLPDIRHTAINLVPVIDHIMHLETTRKIVDRAERRLETWNVVGVLFIAIILALILVLA